jgi:hypothetical protein
MRSYAARRAGLALAAAAALAAGLTGCEKPLPSVSMFTTTNLTVLSTDNIVREEALCWAFDPADRVQADDCTPDRVPTLEVVPGDVIGISVDPVVADRTWYPAIGESALSGAPLTETYFRFTLTESDLAEGTLDLRVVALGAGEKESQASGLWVVRIARA